MVARQQNFTENLGELNHIYERIAKIGQDVADKILEIYCLYQISSTLSGTLDLQASVKVFQNLLKDVLNIHAFALYMLDETTHELEYTHGFGFNQRSIHQLLKRLKQGTFQSLVAQNSVSVHSAVLQKAKGNEGLHQMHFDSKGTYLFYPIISELEEPVGCIVLYRRFPHQIAPAEINLLEKVCSQFARVVDKILIYHHTRELSITDDLTQVFNRRYFNQRFEREIQRALRYNRPLTVIMADIDHFKSVNDAHGHFYGDEVLQTVAAIMDRNLRKTDILARFGGEEFVVLLPEIDKQHGMKVAEKLRRAVERYPFPKGAPENQNKITLSLGLSSFPEDATTGEVLLEFADKALYRAKTRGRNRVIVYQKNGTATESFSTRYRLAAAGTRR